MGKEANKIKDLDTKNDLHNISKLPHINDSLNFYVKKSQKIRVGEKIAQILTLRGVYNFNCPVLTPVI